MSSRWPGRNVSTPKRFFASRWMAAQSIRFIVIVKLRRVPAPRRRPGASGRRDRPRERRDLAASGQALPERDVSLDGKLQLAEELRRPLPDGALGERNERLVHGKDDAESEHLDQIETEPQLGLDLYLVRIRQVARRDADPCAPAHVRSELQPADAAAESVHVRDPVEKRPCRYPADPDRAVRDLIRLAGALARQLESEPQLRPAVGLVLPSALGGAELPLDPGDDSALPSVTELQSEPRRAVREPVVEEGGSRWPEDDLAASALAGQLLL